MTVKVTYFVHGTTTDNQKDVATGWSPGELSELGVRQSKELGKMVEDKRFDVVFCSDLRRAVESANLAFGGKYRIIKDKRLREVDYGDFTRKPAGFFKEDMAKYVETPFPNGESYREVEERVDDFLGFLKDNYDGKHVAIVAHQGPQLALEVLLNNKTWKQAIEQDWREVGEWQPGWEYIIE